MRLLNHESSPRSRHIPHLVSKHQNLTLHIATNVAIPGLQTPRLKRLAEIVSAQAIAQQEKLDYPSEDGTNELNEESAEEIEANGS